MEDKDLLPLDVGILITARIEGVYKSQFRIADWLESLLNRIEPSVRDYVATQSFDEWIRKKEAMGGDILRVIQPLIGEFKNKYGISIVSIEVRTIDPPKEYRQATLRKWEAEREKERITTLAEAERERIEKVYRTIEARGDFGKLIRALEALEKSPEKGAKWVVAVPGLSDLLSAVFPGRTIPSLTPEEIQKLKNLLKTLPR